MEAHGLTVDAFVDRAKAAMFLATDRPHALRQCINCCRKGGTISVPGVYGGFLDKIPFGAVMQKGLTMKTGQTHLEKDFKPLTEVNQPSKIHPTSLVTHRLPPSSAPHACR